RRRFASACFRFSHSGSGENMVIRVKKNAKDRSFGPEHRRWSRRDFLEHGLYTTTLAAAVPGALATGLAKDAMAALNCPAVSSGTPGGIAHIHGDGGFSIGAYVLSGNSNTDQLNIASAGSNAANMYGVTGGAALSPCFANGGLA